MDLPIKEELAIYVIKGKVEYNKQIINSHTMLVIDSLNLYKLDALSHSHIVIISGDKLSHRFIEWNLFQVIKIESKKQKITGKMADLKKYMVMKKSLFHYHNKRIKNFQYYHLS